jgi:hypothetical protein
MVEGVSGGGVGVRGAISIWVCCESFSRFERLMRFESLRQFERFTGVRQEGYRADCVVWAGAFSIVQSVSANINTIGCLLC